MIYNKTYWAVFICINEAALILEVFDVLHGSSVWLMLLCAGLNMYGLFGSIHYYRKSE